MKILNMQRFVPPLNETVYELKGKVIHKSDHAIIETQKGLVRVESLELSDPEWIIEESNFPKEGEEFYYFETRAKGGKSFNEYDKRDLYDVLPEL